MAYNFTFHYRYQLTLPLSPSHAFFTRLEAREVQSVVKRTLFNNDDTDLDPKFYALHR